MKYAVTVLFDASRDITVEADSPEEAEQKAYDEVGSATLCNQCSHEVEMGDALGTHVYEDEGSGPQVLNTTYHAQRIAALEAEVARRAEELARIRQHLPMFAALMDEAANLLEDLGPTVLEQSSLARYPLADELGGAASLARDALGQPAEKGGSV